MKNGELGKEQEHCCAEHKKHNKIILHTEAFPCSAAAGAASGIRFKTQPTTNETVGIADFLAHSHSLIGLIPRRVRSLLSPTNKTAPMQKPVVLERNIIAAM